MSDQACAASAPPPSLTGDNVTASLNWPEIARDHSRHANSRPTTLTDVDLQERSSDLERRRLWLPERAKAYAELDDATAAARTRLGKDGAPAVLEGTDEEVRHVHS